MTQNITLSALRMPCVSTSPCLISIEPLVPSLASTISTPFSCTLRAAACTCSPVSVGMPTSKMPQSMLTGNANCVVGQDWPAAVQRLLDQHHPESQDHHGALCAQLGQHYVHTLLLHTASSCLHLLVCLCGHSYMHRATQSMSTVFKYSFCHTPASLKQQHL